MANGQEYRIERQIEIAAPISKVWKSLVDHKAFGIWFKARVDQPFEEGKVSTGQMTYPGYEHYKWFSVTEKIQPETYFSFYWPHIESASEDVSVAPRTLVEFKLEKSGTGTKLTIIESGFENLPEKMRLEALRSNTGGWEQQAKNIEAYATKN